MGKSWSDISKFYKLGTGLNDRYIVLCAGRDFLGREDPMARSSSGLATTAVGTPNLSAHTKKGRVTTMSEEHDDEWRKRLAEKKAWWRALALENERSQIEGKHCFLVFNQLSIIIVCRPPIFSVKL